MLGISQGRFNRDCRRLRRLIVALTASHLSLADLLNQAGTRTKAIELCLLYVSVEEDMAQGVIVSV